MDIFKKLFSKVTTKQVVIIWHLMALVSLCICIFCFPVHTGVIYINATKIPLFPFWFIICATVTVSPILYWIIKFVKFNKAIILKLFKVGGILASTLLLFGGVGFGIFKVVNSATLPKCDSSYAEKEVIEIFKQNNERYKKLQGFNLVKDVTMSLIVPESYDKELKKYECTARLTINPSQSYGIPKYIMYPFSTYDVVGRGWYSNATCDVRYTIYKERGKNQVKSSYCGGTYEDLNYVNSLGLNDVVLGDRRDY